MALGLAKQGLPERPDLKSDFSSSLVQFRRLLSHTVRYTELAPDRFKNFWR
jgi:hypothetical protein